MIIRSIRIAEKERKKDIHSSRRKNLYCIKDFLHLLANIPANATLWISVTLRTMLIAAKTLQRFTKYPTDG